MPQRAPGDSYLLIVIINIQHSTFNIQKNESEHLENNSSDSHQHTDRYRYYARSNELHGIKKKIDRSPHYEESGHFRSTENSGHEGSKSLRVIFNPPKIPVIKVTVIKVIKDFGVQKYPSTSLYLIK